MALHWDGAQWTTVPIPTAGNYVDTVNAVVALSPHDIWSAGSSIADAYGKNLGLIERYSDPCP
jgi:hypothetical protein